ncbi:MAG: PKD domain-containing protein [Euryarchaeota archaeon]|nr:PKD domain-containing protein [Euryarchaeota archaeon]MDE1879661.1 PKD domain-containing protein [Euryarchaeota archaeon]MDE2045187.1 PKD domain-containing protein [Thermoplasmata archaeon]
MASFLGVVVVLALAALMLVPTVPSTSVSVRDTSARLPHGFDTAQVGAAALPCMLRPAMMLHCTSSGASVSGVARGVVSSSAWSSASPSPFWKEICGTGGCGLGDREDPQAAFDPIDNEVVLFGGVNASGSGTVYGDTWTFANGVWTQIFPAVSPPARFDGVMTWDAADGYIVLFSGCASLAGCPPALTDTWSFIGGVWTQLTPTSVPTGRFFGSMAWDGVDNYDLLYGGYSSAGFLGDTWSFVGGQWTQLTPTTTPGLRYAMGLAWDPSDGYDVLFGGDSSTSGQVGDTWSYVGGVWTQLAPTTSPPARGLQNSQMDTDGGSPLIWGGYDFNTGQCFADTWTFAGGQWTQQSPTTSPPPKGWGLVVGTPAGSLTIGGYQCGLSDVGDTWQYISGPHVSTPVPSPANPESGVKVTFTSSVLYAGTSPDTLSWTWAPAKWIQCTPSTSLYLNCTPLREGNYSITIHITDATGMTGSATLSPFFVSRGPQVSQPQPTRVKLDVGQTVTLTSTLVYAGSGSDTFSWSSSGSGMGCAVSSTLTDTCKPTAAGTYNVTAYVSDGVGQGWNTSVNIVVSALPASNAPIPWPGPSADVGQTVRFSANITNVGSGGDKFSWTFAPAQGLDCSASFSVSTVCATATAGWYNVSFNMVDSNGGQGFGTLGFQVFALPNLSAPSPSKTSVDVGQTVSFSPTVNWAGSGGLSYLWNSSGDGFGCGANTLGSYSCTPSTAGTYSVATRGTDSNGGVGRSVSLAYTVFALPQATAPMPSNLHPQVGESITFSTSLLSHGSGGVVYSWTSSSSQLGCASSTSGNLTCTPSATGSYTVTVTVKDSNHGWSSVISLPVSVTNTLTLSVSASPTSGTAPVQVTFTSAPSGGTAPYLYTWKFGDDSAAANEPSPTHTYASGGTFLVSVWVNDSAGHSATDTVSVSVLAPASPSVFSVIPGGMVTFALLLLLAVVIIAAMVLLYRRARHHAVAAAAATSSATYAPSPTSTGPGGSTEPPA